MNRIGLLHLAAAASIAAVSFCLWLELEGSDELETARESAPIELGSLGPAPHAFEVQAPIAGLEDADVSSRENEGLEAMATPLPSLADQVMADWEESQRRRVYNDLLEVMRLSPADEESFLYLLATRYDGETQVARQAAQETETALQALLKAHWAKFVAYEEDMEERMSVMQCDEMMAAHDVQMSPDQRRQLVSLLAQVRRSLVGPRTDQPDAWMQTERVFQQTVLREAANVLKPGQFEAFRVALQQQLDASQLTLELVSHLTPEGTTGASAFPFPRQ